MLLGGCGGGGGGSRGAGGLPLQLLMLMLLLRVACRGGPGRRQRGAREALAAEAVHVVLAVGLAQEQV